MKAITGRRGLLRSLLLAMAAFGASACATSRGVIDIRPDVGIAPSEGPAVVLSAVEDRRRFEVAPRDASVPSLKDRRIDDVSITSRAIARKRNTYGKALGDVLLPEGRRVEDVVAEAVTLALHGRGYRVLSPGEAAGAEADSLRVEILEMWAWATPGFWAMHLESRLHLRITGTRPPFHGGREFRGYVRLATQAATGAAWKNTIDKGIRSLIEDIDRQLSSPDSPPPGTHRP